MIYFVCIELYLMMFNIPGSYNCIYYLIYVTIQNTDLYVTYFVQNYILTSLDSYHSDSVFNRIIFRIVN